MSITERVTQIEQEKRDRMAKDKAEAAPQKSELELQKEITARVLKESGILQSFVEIKENLLDGYKKEFYNCPSHNTYRSSITPHTIILEWGTQGVGDFNDHYFIEAEYVHEAEEIVLTGGYERRLVKKEWTDEKIVEDAMIQLFSNAGFHTAPRDTYDSRFDAVN